MSEICHPQVPPARRVLLLCHEPVGETMAGPAIRYLELARVLSAEFEVRLAHTGASGVSVYGTPLLTFRYGQYEDLALAAGWADAIVVSGYLLHSFPQLATCGKPLVVDIYDVFLFENLEHHRSLPLVDQSRAIAGDLGAISTMLGAGDFFICATERQRDFWLGMLAANGRVNPWTYAGDRSLRSLVDIVPFGIQSRPPQKSPPLLKGVHPKIGADDKLLVWGGGLWDWLDPQTLVKAMARVRERRSDVKLLFTVRRHADRSTVPGMRAAVETERLSGELGLLNEHVLFGNWVPYAERGGYLLEADLGASLHLAGCETHFAFRTRLLDYIWAGLPVVATGGDSMSDLIGAQGLGRVASPGDVEGVAESILSLLAEEGLRARLAPEFARVAEQLTWEKVAEPLRRFLVDPRLAADRLAGGRRVLQKQVPAVSATGPTPYWLLPSRAIEALRRGGLRSLRWEAERYWRWWRLSRR